MKFVDHYIANATTIELVARDQFNHDKQNRLPYIGVKTMQALKSALTRFERTQTKTGARVHCYIVIDGTGFNYQDL